MKVQVFILLSLMCYTAFSAFIKTHGAGPATNGFALGILDTGECQIQDSNGNFHDYGSATAGVEPKGLFMIGSNLWVVLQVKAASALWTNGDHSTTGNKNIFDDLFIKSTSTPVDDTILIGKVETTSTPAPDHFGKFKWGTFISGYTATPAAAFGAFDVSETVICGSIIQMQGTVTNTLTDQTGAIQTGATGAGAYLAFNTTEAAGPNTYTYKGYAPTAPKCVFPLPTEEEEEEEEEQNSATILSMSSALLALFGIFNL